MRPLQRAWSNLFCCEGVKKVRSMFTFHRTAAHKLEEESRYKDNHKAHKKGVHDAYCDQHERCCVNFERIRHPLVRIEHTLHENQRQDDKKDFNGGETCIHA